MLFIDEEGMPWASPSFDACTSWIFLGVTMGASPSLSFCPSFILLHHSSLPTLENFLHTKLITILISSVSAIIIVIQSTKFSMTYEKHVMSISYCSTTSIKFFDQENSKRWAKRGKCKTVQESVKTEQFVKIDFSKIVTLLKSKNFELMKVP